MSRAMMPSQTPNVTSTDTLPKEKSKGRKSSSKGEETGYPNCRVPQFINVTNSTPLGESARTQIRAQVMRDYHRRRIQNVDETEFAIREAAPEPTNVKSQSHKFRFEKEKGLRPWAPAKTPSGRRRRLAESGRRNALNSDEPERNSIKSYSATNDHFRSMSLSHDQELGSISAGETFPAATPANNWPSSLEFAIQTSVLYHSPGTGLLDPFAATSILINSRTQTLIHHYFNERFQTSWLMIPMRKMLFSLGINDVALFHSLLCHYSGSYNVHFQTGNEDEALNHASIAAKLVNRRLADPAQALTNETIATVANMAAFQCSNGSVESMIIHMDGLEKMVNMRGGIQSGGFPMIVQRMIAWSDYHAATAASGKPRFPPLNIPETEQPEDFFYPPVTQVSNPSRFQPSDSINREIQHHNLDRLLAGVRDLSKLLRKLRKQPSFLEDNIWYSDKIYYLQRNLVELVYCMSNPRPIDRACAIAALMYCGHCLRDVPLTFQVTAWAVTRLKAAIIEYEEENFLLADNEVKKLKFWTLGFGGVAAEGKPERDWFIAKFRSSCDDLHINDWETARGILGGVLWQAELDDAASKLWLEAILVHFEE